MTEDDGNVEDNNDDSDNKRDGDKGVMKEKIKERGAQL